MWLFFRDFASSVSRYNSVAELTDAAVGESEISAAATDADAVYA